jgi:hypothetical protein
VPLHQGPDQGCAGSSSYSNIAAIHQRYAPVQRLKPSDLGYSLYAEQSLLGIPNNMVMHLFLPGVGEAGGEDRQYSGATMPNGSGEVSKQACCHQLLEALQALYKYIRAEPSILPVVRDMAGIRE